jgi:hypothetical protein
VETSKKETATPEAPESRSSFLISDFRFQISDSVNFRSVI